VPALVVNEYPGILEEVDQAVQAPNPVDEELPDPGVEDEHWGPELEEVDELLSDDDAGDGDPDHPEHADLDDANVAMDEVDDVAPDAVGEVEDPDLDARMDAAYGRRGGRYRLWPRRNRTYEHLHAQLVAHMFGQVADTSQYNVNAGIKKFGDAGVDAILSELKQIHELGAILPIDPSKISVRQRKRAL
jgi:hypothetical protein